MKNTKLPREISMLIEIYTAFKKIKILKSA